MYKVLLTGSFTASLKTDKVQRTKHF